MSNEIQVFNNSEFGELEIVEINGKPYFPATKCAEILGYSNPQKAIRDHCNGVNESFTPTAGGGQYVKFIPEGDLYRLIVRSNLPAAERFEKWVFDDVIPTIRKHGLYAADELLANPDLFINALQQLKLERTKTAALTERTAIQEQQIAEMRPKAGYYDVVLACKDTVAISVIAKDYGKTAQWMNAMLHDEGVQFKQGKIWLLYRNYAENGYTVTQTHIHPGKDGEQHSTVHTYWTQKGRLFIYGLLKSKNILPLIEKAAA
jgi:prophage antirepressor-like protein